MCMWRRLPDTLVLLRSNEVNWKLGCFFIWSILVLEQNSRWKIRNNIDYSDATATFTWVRPPILIFFFYSVRALHTAGLHLLIEQTVCRVTKRLAAHYGCVLIPSSSLPTALVWWSFCKVTLPKLVVFCAVHYHFKFVTLMSVSKQKCTTHIQNSHFSR